MSERSSGGLRALSNPAAYSGLQRALGAEAVRRAFVGGHLRPAPGERILDLGCGPGDIVELLEDVHYVGVDSSEAYVAAARSLRGARGRFVCGDVTSDALELAEQPGSFDAAISVGVLHHLDDAGVRSLARVAAGLLAPEGRLVTLDPVRAPHQPRIARWLIGLDRGTAIRDEHGYRRLLAESFASVSASVRHDLARVPYSHVVIECREPRSGRGA